MLAQGTCKCARPLRGSFFMPEYECRSALTLHVCLSCCVPPTPRAPLVLHGTCIASSFAELAQHFVCACTAPASRAPFVTRCPCRSRVRVAVLFVASWLLRWRWSRVRTAGEVPFVRPLAVERRRLRGLVVVPCSWVLCAPQIARVGGCVGW